MSTEERDASVDHERYIRYTYTGDLRDRAGRSTFCAGCGAILIERDWYNLGAWRLDPDGRSGACGQRCAGVFDRAPGSWGGRRLPVGLRNRGS